MMIKSDKKYKELDTLLKKGNELAIIQGITRLREEEPFERAVGLLVSWYDANRGTMASKSIEEFFNDLKNKDLRQEIITEITGNWSAETIRMLAASCWQSGLDYSDYSVELAKVFVGSDYSTAIECFTVLEESNNSIPENKRKEIISILNADEGNAEPAKMNLTRELISVLGNR